MQKYSNLRGFNKTPAQVSEDIYNRLHKPIVKKDDMPNKKIEVKKQIEIMNKMNRKLGG